MLTLDDIERIIEDRREDARKALLLLAEIKELQDFDAILAADGVELTHVGTTDKTLKQVGLRTGNRYKDLLTARTFQAIRQDISEAIDRRAAALEASI